MYWFCVNTESRTVAVIYSANDPYETPGAFWDVTIPYDNEQDANEAANDCRNEWNA